ncbi:hypothetical protein OUZ56_017490 [Daphnia magna]|uniref:Uncharacterized protein n=1 Tax=Daphnia magna TaxID=35525 RepID=A0ABR0AT27_9CRUS|nr:hypothetical protein OUZ56_017490 [Daphnia magna]
MNFSLANHTNSSPHLESNIDLQHHIQKRYTYAIDNDREGRRGDGHIGKGWVLRFKAITHINSSPHLESITDLKHHIQKRYTYAIDSDVQYETQNSQIIQLQYDHQNSLTDPGAI